MEGLLDKDVLVLGLGMSGRSAAAFCARQGSRVVAVDERDLPAEPIEGDVDVRVGQAFPDPADFDLVVPSPGVPRERYAARARLVWGDVELAARALAVPIVAVTGTNGKSTSVRLIEAMLVAAGLRARAAGNVGEPALDLVGQPLDVAILEVSSFQLESVDSFQPRVSVLLNVSPDHLDRHGSLEGYVAAKRRIFARQGAADFAVLNRNDERVAALGSELACPVLWFATRGPVERGGFIDGDSVVLRGLGETARLPLPEAFRTGPAAENAVAALVAATAVGADPAKAVGALLSFRNLPHRMELVAERGGARFVDDSKATNPGAAEAALRGQNAPVVWLAGGRQKGLSFAPLAEAARGRVRHAILFGEAADAIATALGDAAPCERVADLDAAVARAAAVAGTGDVVLLSPACASFDQFTSFEERGRRFRALAQALPEGARS